MRFKDLRGFILTMILLIIDIVIVTLSIMDQERGKMIIALTLSFVIVLSFIRQFYNQVLDDCLLIYVFRGIGLLPMIIEFEDIEVYAKGRKNSIYLFDTNKYINCLKSKQVTFMIERNEVTG